MWLLLIVILVLFVGIFYVGRQRFYPSADRHDAADILYEKAYSLLSPTELSFYEVLRQAVGDSRLIFAKVRLADIFAVTVDLETREGIAAFNRIAKTHVDFVLCDPESLEVVAAIELDDDGHGLDGILKQDDFISEVFATVGLPLVRIAARKSYALADVAELLADFMPSDDDVDSAAPVDETDETDDAEEKFQFGAVDLSLVRDKSFRFSAKPEAKPLCPRCGKLMVSQVKDDGSAVWCCCDFPACPTEIDPPRE